MDNPKIVLDADVIIHFTKGGRLDELANIFPQHKYVVLSTVYDEIFQPTKNELDKILALMKNIEVEKFEPIGEMKKEYSILTGKFGKGESACMAYCKFKNDIIGSSNVKDIKKYCDNNNIKYLTTVDFLYNSIKNGIMTIAEANDFCKIVKNKGSRLPDVDFNSFVSTVTL